MILYKYTNSAINYGSEKKNCILILEEEIKA